MGKAKNIELRPIPAGQANELVKRIHYSGKVVQNSQIHIGVFYDGRLEGAMQFGPSLDKRKIQGLVSGTQWHEFIELNRMAFSEALPRNSESRAIAVAMRLLRKHAPQLKWVISFADGTQCGDGTIYRASGFVLTGIKRNDQIWVAPDEGATESRTSLTDNRSKRQQAAANRYTTAVSRVSVTKGKAIHTASLRPGIGAIGTAASYGGGSSMKKYIEAGFKPLDGYQLRYIYFLDASYRERLTVPELPYSEIERVGAGMYRGVKRADEATGVATGNQLAKGQFESDPSAPFIPNETT